MKQLYFRLTLGVIVLLLFSSFSRIDVVSDDDNPLKINLSIDVKEVSVVTFFNELKSKTGGKLTFVYVMEDLDDIKSITIKHNLISVEKLLDELIKPYDLSYSVNNNVVTIKKNKQVPKVTIKIIDGRVIDADTKRPIAGATVLISGTTKGAISDNDGLFVLSANPGDNLSVSYVGMQELNYTITLTDKQIVLALKKDVLSVDDVIVTGMFTRKAESFTGSAKTLTSKDLERVGNGNLFQSLKNLDPSLNFVENNLFGSDTNKLPTMQLRGTSTFPIESSSDLRSNFQGDPNQPLFILDGFEVNTTKVFDLDVNRIQSVTILKDAAAKAIYGSKAANGVVVIETKKPVGGEFRVTYKGSVDVTMPDLSSYNLANAKEKLEIEKTAGLYNSSSIQNHLKLQQQYNDRMKMVLEGLDTYWLAKPLHTGVGTKHSLSFEMGERNLTAIANVSYNSISGVMKESKRNVISGDLNLSYRLGAKFLFRNIMSITSNTSYDSPYGVFSEYAYMNPYYSPYDKSGNITKDNNNPLYNSTLNTRSSSGYLEFGNNFYTEYTIINDLKAVARIGVSTQQSNGDIFYPANHTRFSNYEEADFMRRGSYQQNSGTRNDLSADLTLQYSKQIGKHFLMANFAYNINSQKYNEIVHYAEGFPSDRMDDMTFALQYAKNKTPNGMESIVRNVGVVGVVGYTYDDRFLSDFTLRRNASSQFGANSRWGTFWSLGLGWNLHNEKFMQNIDWFRQFKVRGSVGTTGSQSFESYQSIATYKYYTDASYAGMLGAYVMRMANEDLKWQEKIDYNVGFDARMWKFTFSFDYYQSITNNLIVDLSLPTSVGYSSVKENIGKVRNKGIDASLTYNVFSNRNGFLNLTAAVTTNNNEILQLSDAMRAFNSRQDELVSSKLDGGISKPVLRYVEGGSLNSIWAVQSLGINPNNGREIYVTPDGNTTYTWKSNYQQIVGNDIEKIRGNFGFNGEYKGVGLSVTFRYSMGADYYNQTLVDKVENADLSGNVDKRILYGRWSETNKNAPFKTLEPYNDVNGNYIKVPRTSPTSRFVQRKNEIDISSVSVYYDMRDRAWLNKIGLRRLKAALNMNDISKFSTIQVERGTSYPFARTMSFSLTAEF